MILLELFFTFFKIGLFTFGGGYAMLPLIQSEVQAQGWMTQSALVDFIAVSESTPGPFAINIATYVGSETAGVLGSVCATLGVVMPSFIVILIVAQCYEKFKESFAVKGVLSGLRPAAIGLIGSAVLTAAATVFIPAEPAPILEVITSYEFICGAVIFAICLPLILNKKKKIHPIIVIALAAALGIASGYAPMLIK
ncbi:MAG: chromate transporter [Oscillospiraceae bacterium]|nr:chromate transporter [Oscillospiraceae bacterium]